ncbi:MAG: manganese efflux pump MntP family protein [Treponema sp.]|jgi:putative Mn2+ efflux pump MntP|nr:manganese efflux pump MntP family protein [Treponema sp.]
MLPVILIGLSLSMDAFAVSVSSGICIPGLRPFHAIRASLSFGIFQFIMPLAGWYLGSAFAAYINAVDHWIAFGLLALIGGKELWEALTEKAAAGPCGPDEAPGEGGSAAREPGAPEPGAREHETRGPKKSADIRNTLTLLNLSVATSIDALAVGISLSIMGHNIWLSAAVIGGVTFLVCLSGFEFGRRLGGLFRKGARIAGGLILIGIGVKILAEHLFR